MDILAKSAYFGALLDLLAPLDSRGVDDFKIEIQDFEAEI